MHPKGWTDTVPSIVAGLIITVERMREAFHGDLTELAEQLAGMCSLAAEEAREATSALLTNDLALAERVVSADSELDHQRKACEERALTLLALQSPVASDLRSILAVVYCAANIERMGDLATHIAKIVRFTHPDQPVPAELRDTFSELGQRTVAMAEHVRDLIAGAATHGFDDLNRHEDVVDTLCANVMTTITRRDWPHGICSATNLALLVRFYERFGDQVIRVARRLHFAATGSDPYDPE